MVKNSIFQIRFFQIFTDFSGQLIKLQKSQFLALPHGPYGQSPKKVDFFL